MNRKFLFGLVIVICFGLYLYLKTKQENVKSSEDFASTSKIIPAKQEPIATEKRVDAVSVTEAQNITNTANPKSGKYGIRISKPVISIQDEALKRDEYLNQNKTDIVLNSGDQNLVLMKLRAGKERSELTSKHDRSLGHDIFQIDANSARKVLVEEDTYPVVYRESNGRIGLLTGILLIQTSENSLVEKLAVNYPMDLQSFDPAINLAAYKVQTGNGLYDVYNLIKQKERIRSITVEVLDSYKGY